MRLETRFPVPFSHRIRSWSIPRLGDSPRRPCAARLAAHPRTDAVNRADGMFGAKRTLGCRLPPWQHCQLVASRSGCAKLDCGRTAHLCWILVSDLGSFAECAPRTGGVHGQNSHIRHHCPHGRSTIHRREVRAADLASVHTGNEFGVPGANIERADCAPQLLSRALHRRFPDKRLRARRRRCEQIFVMQAGQHRFSKHECTRRQSMARF